MSSYPIWIEVLSCIYKSPKSYGVRRDGNQTVYVGTSRKNSHPFARIRLTHREYDDGTRSYWLKVDGHLLKEAHLTKNGEFRMESARRIT